ncbi:hypothetical protein JDW19_22785 [Paenibacillus polymyxa]|uniref:DUF3806 domain-containing protein n=1 Tax=Paenibacillus polymyxa TaxID=1406 RepID=A0A8I1J9J9_PAEPO|nr:MULTISPECIES: hypothetical protein [Paenibacillus]KAF6570564.1 hypothetical protein G9G53_19915 [Paenibacillus sp. EKM206P]KAF6588024.1 hypothetical protein G9G52_16570 [Paenibacillus sp. EKM205P]MBM0635931.1 hypothetical protein [Paenibacillus polymyxa]
MEDLEIQETINKYCELAISYAQSFNCNLTFEEPSIHTVEEILNHNWNKLKNADEEEKPTDNQIWSMAVVWGTYVGEVMKKSIGEPCKWIFEDGELLLEINKIKANPIIKAYKRIINGPEDSIVSFYDIGCMKLKEYIGTGSW